MDFEFWIVRGRLPLWNLVFRKELCVAFRLRAIRVFRVKRSLTPAPSPNGEGSRWYHFPQNKQLVYL